MCRGDSGRRAFGRDLAGEELTKDPPALRRPVLRGWLHALAIGPAVIGTAVLVGAAPGDSVKQLSLLLYGATLISLFTVSAIYHVGTWSPERRAMIRRLDNSNIFVMIAGTYTPIVVTVLTDFARVAMLAAIWTLAIAGVFVVVRRISLRHGILIGLYLALGWLAVLVLPLLEQRVGWGGIALLAAGGVFYSLGAASYGLKRPRLWPSVFSYHELFHLLVIAASASFYLFIARDVVPLAVR
jgi:hemolysin III